MIMKKVLFGLVGLVCLVMIWINWVREEYSIKQYDGCDYTW
jgi:hypothetical protein